VILRQNTPEWLEVRKTKLGASDAPAILGISPYKTAYQLFLEKMGLVQDEDTYQLSYGVFCNAVAGVSYHHC